MHRTKARFIAALGLTTLTASTLAIALPAGAQATTTDVSVEWSISQDWGTGYQGTVRIINNSGRVINPWSVTIPYSNAITSIWDATSTVTTGGYRFTGPSWNTSIANGTAITFGFLGSPRGGSLAPTTCTIPTGTCSVVGAPSSASTPAPTPTPTASPTVAPSPIATSTPAPTASPSASTPSSTGTSTSTSNAAITVSVKVTSDWGTGRNVDLTVTNTSASPINGWSISIPWSGSSISMWNAAGSLAGGRLTATNLSWNAVLAPGAAATMGMTDNGNFVAPATCTSSAGSCAIAGSSSISPASPTPTASPSASTTATPSPTSVTPYTPKSGSYTGGKKIVGYYPAWATYARNYQVTDMAAGKLTHINYAFANIANGKCVLGDSYADTDKAFAGDSWDQGALRGNFNQLAKLKTAHPSLKTMISIGGWTWSQNFSAAAASEQSREEFVSSCVAFMKQYKFDGIDIDWEYPVSGGLYGGVPADKQNYTALLQEFRSELDTQGSADGGKHYSLSIAAPAGPSIIPNLEVSKIASSLDWMNLMSYDYHGGWDPITGHNAHMAVGSKDAAKGFSITDTVDSYLSGGFPAAKLVLGVPFYGRGWENVSSTDVGLYQAGTSASVGTWEKGVFDYTDIRANYLPSMTRYWDAQAQVPYLYDSARKLWISYDDTQSMVIKTDYIKSKGLGGAMAWEMSGDRDQELLDTLVANL